MNDYGIPPTSLTFLSLENGYYPHEDDVYDPNLPNFGNRNYGKSQALSTLGWDFSSDSEVDIRLFYSYRNRKDWVACRWDPNDSTVPKFYRYSDVTGN